MSAGGARVEEGYTSIYISAGAIALALGLAGCASPEDPNHDARNPVAVIGTSMGEITAELYANKAPETVENLLRYAREGFYDGLIFHRVIDDFVIQGGGVWPNGTERGAHAPIPLETHPDLTHVDGALGMAREPEPDTATSQFYITDGKQHRLDDANRMRDRQERGYAVFGEVTSGMEVVRAIASAATDSGDRPLQDVVIVRIEIRTGDGAP